MDGTRLPIAAPTSSHLKPQTPNSELRTANAKPQTPAARDRSPPNQHRSSLSPTHGHRWPVPWNWRASAPSAPCETASFAFNGESKVETDLLSEGQGFESRPSR